MSFAGDGYFTAQLQTKKLNLLVIWCDDIGTWNISHHRHGIMSCKAPNTARLGKEGMAFIDWYRERFLSAGSDVGFLSFFLICYAKAVAVEVDLHYALIVLAERIPWASYEAVRCFIWAVLVSAAKAEL